MDPREAAEVEGVTVAEGRHVDTDFAPRGSTARPIAAAAPTTQAEASDATQSERAAKNARFRVAGDYRSEQKNTQK